MQQELLEKLCSLEKPVILVTTGGSAVGLNWAAEHVPAMVHVWYPGEEGGTALAEVLFGDYSPAGRLPVTFVKSLDDVPPFEDYSMKGRTYRYMEAEPLFPFGFGLSYTEFEYGDIKLSSEKIGTDENLQVSITVRNIGSRKADEVVQLYLRQPEAPFTVPLRRLQGIERITLEPAETRTVSFILTPRDLAAIDDEGNCVLVPGQFEAFVGGCQPDPRSQTLTGKKVATARFEVTGSSIHLEY